MQAAQQVGEEHAEEGCHRRVERDEKKTSPEMGRKMV